MPVTVEWDNAEKTIVRMRMIGKWTWDEAYNAQKEGDALINSVTYPVCAIIDLRESGGVPLSAMSNARSMSAKQNSRVKMTVFLGANTLFVSLWNVFSKVYTVFVTRHPFAFAKTIEESHAILNQRLRDLAADAVPKG
ncbi:MAG: hypothetical protein K8L97_05675 [Anaerolineae bacterium]|nr:hypothetical protein [Anaerolineae bacterium]